jgi:hypothetical protein
VATNERVTSPGGLANLFTTARQLHERLLINWGWLVTASTIAMLILFTLGVLMGRGCAIHWLVGTRAPDGFCCRC